MIKIGKIVTIEPKNKHSKKGVIVLFLRNKKSPAKVGKKILKLNRTISFIDSKIIYKLLIWEGVGQIVGQIKPSCKMIVFFESFQGARSKSLLSISEEHKTKTILFLFS